eukprot:TRINITY_DN2703_c0_g2_i3.p1 TRINITY_DN2703_c0_g2~~TRINITY_DN2703_c0_g2_i3.p1  ORF type:complete len:154 (-),score=9.30 TRINITY_DN2703_c0_g2_i3:228-689(-)
MRLALFVLLLYSIDCLAANGEGKGEGNGSGFDHPYNHQPSGQAWDTAVDALQPFIRKLTDHPAGLVCWPIVVDQTQVLGLEVIVGFLDFRSNIQNPQWVIPAVSRDPDHDEVVLVLTTPMEVGPNGNRLQSPPDVINGCPLYWISSNRRPHVA